MSSILSANRPQQVGFLDAAPNLRDRNVLVAELRKFLQLAATRDVPPPMFSGLIDALWHDLLHTPDYAEFSIDACGEVIEHVPTCGTGRVDWIKAYHERFGTRLPAQWFADASGNLDADAYEAYRSTGTVTASWNCSPRRPEGGRKTKS